MAFGIKRDELIEWKQHVKQEKIAFLTHYWIHPKFPSCKTVTKVGCENLSKLANWGFQYGLKEEWIHYNEEFPHFDLIGERQYNILKSEGLWMHIERFKLSPNDCVERSEGL